jgi:hypothetical protein
MVFFKDQRRKERIKHASLVSRAPEDIGFLLRTFGL